MNRKLLGTVLLVTLCAFPFLYATSGVGTSTIYLQGSVGSRLLLDVTQGIGATAGAFSSLPLDEGAVLQSSSAEGVVVGEWSVSSNSSTDLALKVLYDTFTVELEGVIYSIPYTLSNGSEYIASGNLFADLVRTQGMYDASNNSGSIYLKRVDSETYPPSYNYSTTITFSLETN